MGLLCTLLNDTKCFSWQGMEALEHLPSSKNLNVLGFDCQLRRKAEHWEEGFSGVSVVFQSISVPAPWHRMMALSNYSR